MKHYICPLTRAVFEFDRRAETNSKPRWEAPVAAPASGTLVLFSIRWGSLSAMQEFEDHPDVMPLGDPWDAVPTAAVVTLDALRALATIDKAPANPALSAPIDVTNTVAQALRKAVPHLVR